MADALRMDYINSLPQPFTAVMLDGVRWPVYDIAVDIGMLRIDVCGLLDIVSVVEVSEFIDAAGVSHDPDTFWSDYAEAING